MRLATLLLSFGVLCSAQDVRALDQRVIAAAKQVYVDKLDVQLPHLRFELGKATTAVSKTGSPRAPISHFADKHP